VYWDPSRADPSEEGGRRCTDNQLSKVILEGGGEDGELLKLIHASRAAQNVEE